MAATALTIICAWCTRVVVDSGPGAPVSHTICGTCHRVHFPDHYPNGEDEATRLQRNRAAARQELITNGPDETV